MKLIDIFDKAITRLPCSTYVQFFLSNTCRVPWLELGCFLNKIGASQ